MLHSLDKLDELQLCGKKRGKKTQSYQISKVRTAASSQRAFRKKTNSAQSLLFSIGTGVFAGWIYFCHIFKATFIGINY